MAWRKGNVHISLWKSTGVEQDWLLGVALPTLVFN
jgi:hypothetical protein